jgi:hypothetical protein
MTEYFSPNLDAQVAEILRETERLRHMGLLSPFKEGEPIGAYQYRAQYHPTPETPAQRWARRQEELRAYRVKNDRALARMMKETDERT